MALLLAMCAAPPLPDVDELMLGTGFSSTQSLAGVTLMARPLLDGSELEQWFGFDLRSEGVLPIVVSVRNEAKEVLLVRRDDFSLSRAQAEPTPSTPSDRVPGWTGPAGVAARVLAPLVPVIVVLSVIEGRVDRAKRNTIQIIASEFSDGTLFPGQERRGVLFFPVGESPLGPEVTLSLRINEFGTDGSLDTSVSLEQR